MVKHWPEQVVRRIYDILMGLWESEHIPEFVKWRWITLLPKVEGSVKLSEMRPISLLEVVRKLWNSFFAGKLNRFLSKNKIPHPSQHAYWARSGTDAASLNIINTLELLFAGNGTMGCPHLTSKERLTVYRRL